MKLVLPADQIPAELAGFPMAIELPIQWGDQDAFGHVNNAVPFKWFESCRIAYLRESGVAGLMRADGLGPILASTSCDYRKQMRFPDAVVIGGRVAEIGRSSMTMEHAVYSREQNAVTAEGRAVVVIFNYEKQRPTRMPEELRAALGKTGGR